MGNKVINKGVIGGNLKEEKFLLQLTKQLDH